MTRTTIKQLAKLAKQNNTPLLGKAEQLATIPFMAGYLSAYPTIDRNTQVNRGIFAPIWNRDEEDTDEEVLSQFQDDIFGMIIKNQNEYQRLWDALVEADYNPIENYDRNEYWNDVESGSNTLTDDVAKRKQTLGYAQLQTTREEEQQALGSNGFVDGPNKETETVGQHTNTVDDDAYKDTHKTDFGHENEHQGRVHGNVGVTTNQQMITSEVDLRTKFKFYDVLINDFINELCGLDDRGLIVI